MPLPPTLRGLFMAIMTYTRIPIPAKIWRDDGDAFVIAWLPICGVIVALAQTIAITLTFLAQTPPLNPAFLAAILTALPVLITGGIHHDGYLDTIDALSSHAPREKKLAILKDPNAGAFAVIYACVLFLLQFGAWSAILSQQTAPASMPRYLAFALPEHAPAALLAPIYARAMCALMLLFLPDARPGGSASRFVTATKNSSMTPQLLLLTALTLILALLGGTIIPTITLVVAVLYCRRKFTREFGGITGDLAGYFIVLTETAALILAALLP